MSSTGYVPRLTNKKSNSKDKDLVELDNVKGMHFFGILTNN